MNGDGAVAQRARRFDAPALSADDTLRVAARHDATVERRRFDAGYHAGHAAGYARGAADVEAAIADHRRNADRLASLCDALDAAIAERRAGDEAAMAAMESAILAMSFDIAQAVIGREVAEREVVVESVQRCLRFDRPDGEVVVSLHPEDLACAAEAIQAGLIEGADVELQPDPTVGRGGCIVDAGSVRIDGRLGPALERIRDALAAH